MLKFLVINDDEVISESIHVIVYGIKLATIMEKDKIIVINLSGHGDKKIFNVAELDGIEV